MTPPREDFDHVAVGWVPEDERPPEDVSDADWQAMCRRAHDAEAEVKRLRATIEIPLTQPNVAQLQALQEEVEQLRPLAENLRKTGDEWFDEVERLEAGSKVLLDRNVELRGERDQLRALLGEAVTVIEGLAEQQAMEDDWWENDRDRFKDALK